MSPTEKLDENERGEARRRRAARGNPRARVALGRAAEELAARHLEQQGCRILARRFGKRGGEIDLVIDDGGVVAFVEVKARRGGRYGTPESAVTAIKRRRLVATARAFLAERGWRGRRCRFDLVGVRVADGRARLQWYRDAFRP